MRYLTLSKTGIWSFRFQIPAIHRPLFEHRFEIKRCLKTSCLQEAKILALQLELEIRQKITKSKLSLEERRIKLVNSSRKQKSTCKDSPFQCLSSYQLYKSSYVSEKTITGAVAKCHLVLRLLNKQKLSSIRRSDAEDVRQLLIKLPSNINKHQQFKDLSPIEAIKLNQELRLPVISPSSVKDYIQKCSSFFEWCVQMEYTDKNPFKGFRFKNETKASAAKNAYSKRQLNQIFRNEIFAKKKFKHSYQYWLPVLAALTGARINELCQLYKKDIKKIGGIWCISINNETPDKRLKTPNAARLIPVHSQLIDIGFIDQIQSITSQRIFPELNLERDGYATAASKWYGRFKTSLGFNKGHDFHSFRHTFANELKNALVPSIVAAELLGHTQETISYERYGKELNLETKLDAIKKLENLPLPSPNNCF
ncbi:TPA: tyrosine-type recombinase/integrase [Vibrio parahaemolyticus]|nr:tyrosine-type recombinase/integrase [Vibrio parahaemolyticus]HAS6465779.1 tyrosine-type recombinase/integrase [Vibrio parahaemolyticus]HAS6911704.1 tyrosine-type recombinase/integrase [Vibrio parahaemolyticus]HAS6914062.1 tyrosine-type recombinase/integrase [Vibrio parahaemolyticus]HAS6921997.1 tyrosine-type recombinase/integrase [Vibrio parahaemolyticus]